MTTREAILDEAATWLGTPFRHQGRIKGIGCDCVGLIIGIARRFGLSDYDCLDYPREPDGATLRARLDARLAPLPLARAKPGDVLLLRIRRHPQHVGILSRRGLIHAHAGSGGVVETRMTARWSERLLAAYRFPGLEDE